MADNDSFAPAVRLAEGGASLAHTPGPWQVSGIRTRLGGEPVLTVGPDGYGIALVLYGNGSTEQHRAAHADARLIAAAPELLGELRRVTDHLDAWARDHSDEATAETWAALHCAREIIAKAEGR